ncbi:zinc ribbon domain-containing protein [Pelagicoccus sp. SDUM812003]|uniref:zinc ribbon domain-containing protein n=1 Tax=Pelagicoccus sp. SDUM812003 TaxID=3041267 RepID=UPI0028105D84|nr:zinc ribbon domain-containing protein [Pelagicoccus sp. SDUM812003]MDQ8204432.1 zinc ribbon domain-containing protein [Pelagicoccus sp. SDUM812003]
MSFEPPGYCPNCGEYVEKGASSCEECGSCPETGWNDEGYLDGVELPGDETEKPDARESSAGKFILIVCLLALLVYVFVLR